MKTPWYLYERSELDDKILAALFILALTFGLMLTAFRALDSARQPWRDCVIQVQVVGPVEFVERR